MSTNEKKILTIKELQQDFFFVRTFYDHFKTQFFLKSKAATKLKGEGLKGFSGPVTMKNLFWGIYVHKFKGVFQSFCKKINDY